MAYTPDEVFTGMQAADSLDLHNGSHAQNRTQPRYVSFTLAAHKPVCFAKQGLCAQCQFPTIIDRGRQQYAHRCTGKVGEPARIKQIQTRIRGVRTYTVLSIVVK